MQSRKPQDSDDNFLQEHLDNNKRKTQGYFGMLPTDVFKLIINQSSPGTLFSLKNTNTFFSNHLQLTKNLIWKKEFSKLGVDESLFETVFNSGLIQNYNYLYQRLVHLNNLKGHTWVTLNNEAWQLYLLSGESEAFTHALKSLDDSQLNTEFLLFTCISGSYENIIKLRETLTHSTALNIFNLNILTCIALSGFPELLVKIKALDDCSNTLLITNEMFTVKGLTCMQAALLSRNPKQVEKVIELSLGSLQDKIKNQTLIEYAHNQELDDEIIAFLENHQPKKSFPG